MHTPIIYPYHFHDWMACCTAAVLSRVYPYRSTTQVVYLLMLYDKTHNIVQALRKSI